VCVYVLASTSNPDAAPNQDIYVDGLTYYQYLAMNIREAYPGRAGLVVGSTKPESIRNIRAAELEKGALPNNMLEILAPGFGKQGGDLASVSLAGQNAVYPISNGLTNTKYLNGKTSLDAAIWWKEKINASLVSAGQGMQK
jgi:orotidine-5'-phosphate decarboxylase